MRVVLNNLTAIGQKTGIGHYVNELVAGLRTQAPDGRFELFPGALLAAGARAMRGVRRGISKLRRQPSPPAVQPPGHDRSWTITWGRACAAWHFRAFWSWRRFDLYHEPNYIPFLCDRPTVATVHDLSVMLHPEWHPRHRVDHFARHFEPGLRRCARLLADSEFTRRELIAAFSVPPEKVRRVPIGIRIDLAPMASTAVEAARRRLGLPENYLLHVGTIEPRKNLLMLMKAYGDLPGPVRQCCPLILAGGWGWNVAEVAEHYDGVARELGVRHLGYVADADLPALYNGARALLFPSHYEGFGLPPLEMMACGGAVIASTAGAVVETVGKHAHLVDPNDLVGWRDAMRRVITEDDWREALARGATEVARPYTWERCARGTFQVYEEVLGKRILMAQAA